jgi:hypothetical protein
MGVIDHGLSGTRGYIRTYNPFVANTPQPYMGSVSAWVMGVDPGAVQDRFAQVGWVKDPTDPLSHDPYNPYVFVQFTNAFGSPQSPEYFSRIGPPDVYFYQVTTDQNGYWGMWWGTQNLLNVQLGWVPTGHEAFVEEQNYTGDQTAGDTTAHVTFRNVDWSDLITWTGSSFGGVNNPYQAGTPGNPASPDRGLAGFDALTYTDGSNFDTWDARCP